MSAFTELDWRRLDVQAIVGASGLAVIHEQQRSPCLAWLGSNRYRVKTLDCRPGLSEAIPKLGLMLNWEEQFGYGLDADNRNLDTLDDGFEFEIPVGEGCVFEVIGADLAWQEDARWLCGLLSIAQAHSRKHLALGRRFFTLLVLPENSGLIGTVIEDTRVPAMFWSPSRQRHAFRG